MMTDRVFRESLRDYGANPPKRKATANQQPGSDRKKSRREPSSAVPPVPSTPSTSTRSTTTFGARHTDARLNGRRGMLHSASATGSLVAPTPGRRAGAGAALLKTPSSAVTGMQGGQGSRGSEDKENAGVGQGAAHDVFATQQYTGDLMVPEGGGAVDGPMQLPTGAPTEKMDGPGGQDVATGSSGMPEDVMEEMIVPAQVPSSSIAPEDATVSQVMDQLGVNTTDQQSDIGGPSEELGAQLQSLEKRVQQLEEQRVEGAVRTEDEGMLLLTVTDPLYVKTSGRGYVQYTITTQCRGGRIVSVFHRYRDCSALHTALTALYAHLVPSVPSLPAKSFKGNLLLIVSRGHFAPDSRTGKFIESRRAALEDWLQGWQTALPSVLREDPAWRSFLGVDGTGRTDDPLRVLYDVAGEAVAGVPAGSGSVA